MSQTNDKTQANRLIALDCFRGLAILLMVLSGSIAFGDVLPAWMYHAQVPPPLHKFIPTLAGITWVDLVFPFFLFSMGAAFPLALKGQIVKTETKYILLKILKRYVLLLFFAIFTHHAKAWVMNSKDNLTENLLSIGCFILLFLMFAKTSTESKLTGGIRQVIGFVLAIVFLGLYPFKDGGFNISESDIIIVVLANMALFGSLIWVLTKNTPWLRLAILPFVMAIFLSGKEAGSWQSIVFNWSPIPWAYTFYYLKYLFIIIPGTFAGDWLIKAQEENLIIIKSKKLIVMALLCLILVVLNTCFLFSRLLIMNLMITLIISAVLFYLNYASKLNKVYQNLMFWGVLLLILGLFFESYEGGIKKDPSTFSYYFVTSGMSFLTVFCFLIIEALGYVKLGFKWIVKVGQNPMIAYTVGSLFLLPLLKITHLEFVFNQLNQTSWGGFSRGIIFTALVAIIAIFFTNKRIFWKT
jgi:predicted acyltransferase